MKRQLASRLASWSYLFRISRSFSDYWYKPAAIGTGEPDKLIFTLALSIMALATSVIRAAVSTLMVPASRPSMVLKSLLSEQLCALVQQARKDGRGDPNVLTGQNPHLPPLKSPRLGDGFYTILNYIRGPVLLLPSNCIGHPVKDTDRNSLFCCH